MDKKTFGFTCIIEKDKKVINTLEATGSAAKKEYTLFLHNYFNAITDKKPYKYKVINKLNDNLKVKCTFNNGLIYIYDFKNINIWEDQNDEKH